MKAFKIILPFLLLSFSINGFSQVNDSIEIHLYKNNVKKDIKKATITFFLVEGTITNDIIDNKFAFPEIDFDKNDSIAFIINYKNYIFWKNTYYYKRFDAENEKNNYWDIYYFDNIKKLIASGQHSYGLEPKEKYVVIHWNYNHLCLYGTGNSSNLINKPSFSRLQVTKEESYQLRTYGYTISKSRKDIPRFIKEYINNQGRKKINFKKYNSYHKRHRNGTRVFNYFFSGYDYYLLSYSIINCRCSKSKLVIFKKDPETSIIKHTFIVGDNSYNNVHNIINSIHDSTYTPAPTNTSF